MGVIFNSCQFPLFSPPAIKNVQTVIPNAAEEENSAADGSKTPSFFSNKPFFANSAQWVVVRLEIEFKFSISTHIISQISSPFTFINTFHCTLFIPV